MTKNETSLSPYIKYRTVHFDKNPDKPVLVLLHGFLGNTKDWDEITTYFSTHFRFILFDLPGHGESVIPLEMELDFEVVVETIYQHIQAHTKSFSLLGYSFGGRVAFGIQRAHPEDVTHLIIESSTPGIQKQSERERRIKFDQNLANQMLEVPFEDFLDNWFDYVVFHNQKRHPQFPALLKRRLTENTPPQLSKSLTELGTGKQPNYWPYLTAISCPMLFVTGEYDTKFKVIGEQLHTPVPHYDFSLVPQVSHNVHFESLDAFLQVLETWFSKVKLIHA